MDFFCLSPIGIRVAYPTPALLGTLSPAERRRVQGRIVLALTADPRYSLHGVRPGTRLASVARRLGTGRRFTVGLNDWYLTPNGPSHGVLKVRNGIIEEIGIADERLTSDARATRRFLQTLG
jgi:hypothetical protein